MQVCIGISLSIDGPNALVHDRQRGVEGTFQRTVELLQAAQAIGLDRQINTTISQANHQHLIEMADLAEWLHVSLWSVFMLVPTGRAEQSVMLDAVSHEKVYRELARLLDNDAYSFDIKTTAGQPFYRVLAQQKARRVKANVEVGVGVGAMTSGKRGTTRAPLGINDGKGFVFIDHIGQVAPSGFLPISVGNVREQPLAHWYREDPLFQALRDPTQLQGKCGDCEFNQICGGSRSRSYALTGDPLAADPTCVYRPRQSA